MAALSNIIKTRLAPHISKPGGGVWGWLALQLMNRRNRRMNEWAIALLTLQPSDHVLELGFGAGTSIQRAARVITQGRVAGIDYAPDAVARATRRNQSAIRAGRVDLRQGDVQALPYAAAEFDKAFCCGLIYYLPDPGAALREVWRILRPGGRFVLMARKPELLRQNPVFALGDHRVYTGDELLALLTDAGFSRVWCASDAPEVPDNTVIAAVGERAPQ